MAATETPIRSSHLSPRQITLSSDRRRLSIAWDETRTDDLSAAFLRSNCRSSNAQRARMEGGNHAADADITIADVRPIGLYAVNITFSDGHDRGIYPWAYLRSIADRRN